MNHARQLRLPQRMLRLVLACAGALTAVASAQAAQGLRLLDGWAPGGWQLRVTSGYFSAQQDLVAVSQGWGQSAAAPATDWQLPQLTLIPASYRFGAGLSMNNNTLAATDPWLPYVGVGVDTHWPQWNLRLNADLGVAAPSLQMAAERYNPQFTIRLTYGF